MDSLRSATKDIQIGIRIEYRTPLLLFFLFIKVPNNKEIFFCMYSMKIGYHILSVAPLYKNFLYLMGEFLFNNNPKYERHSAPNAFRVSILRQKLSYWGESVAGP